MSRRSDGKSKLSRMTPELLAELIAVHSQCVYDQQGRCPRASSGTTRCSPPDP
jgi:hypothetical protein